MVFFFPYQIIDICNFAFTQLDAAVKEAFDIAYDNIYAFHAAQISAEKNVENMPVSNAIIYNVINYMSLQSIYKPYQKLFQGVKCKRVARSIASVGLYVPGGTAVLPSTALMLSIVSYQKHGIFFAKDDRTQFT